MAPKEFRLSPSFRIEHLSQLAVILFICLFTCSLFLPLEYNFQGRETVPVWFALLSQSSRKDLRVQQMPSEYLLSEGVNVGLQRREEFNKHSLDQNWQLEILLRSYGPGQMEARKYSANNYRNVLGVLCCGCEWASLVAQWLRIPLLCRRHRRPGLRGFPGGGHGNLLQYSYLENSMDQGAWWVTVHKVAKSWTRLKATQYSTQTKSEKSPH